MDRYQKKPVVIEAVQITEETFSGPHPNPSHLPGIIYDPASKCVFIRTLEGTMRGDIGDWIIKGVKGEFYPCKPDIFEATYRLADTGDASPFDLLSHLQRQKDFSERTFGPGDRTLGIVDHIDKELAEILANPGEISEWIDVVVLAFDGAWRMGFTPEEIVNALVSKQAKNEGRKWPDWRTAEPGKAIEHIREGAE